MGHNACSPVTRDRWQEQDKFKRLAEELIATTPVLMFSKSYCSFCKKAQAAIRSHPGGDALQVVDLDDLNVHHAFGHLLHDGGITATGPNLTIVAQMACQMISGSATVPQVFIGGKLVGGCDDTLRLDTEGKLAGLIAESPSRVRSPDSASVRLRSATSHGEPGEDVMTGLAEQEPAGDGPLGGDGAKVDGRLHSHVPTWAMMGAAMLGVVVSLWLERRQKGNAR